jgi:hypothetical protein
MVEAGFVARPHPLQETKVFWFLFSKKNCFLPAWLASNE